MQVEIVFKLASKPSEARVQSHWLDFPSPPSLPQVLIVAYEKYPVLKHEALLLCAYGQILNKNHVFEDGERLEFCLPILMDPKEARRLKMQHENKRSKNIKKIT